MDDKDVQMLDSKTKDPKEPQNIINEQVNNFLWVEEQISKLSHKNHSSIIKILEILSLKEPELYRNLENKLEKTITSDIYKLPVINQNLLKESIEQIGPKHIDFILGGCQHTGKYYCWAGKYTCGIWITNKIVWTVSNQENNRSILQMFLNNTTNLHQNDNKNGDILSLAKKSEETYIYNVRQEALLNGLQIFVIEISDTNNVILKVLSDKCKNELKNIQEHIQSLQNQQSPPSQQPIQEQPVLQNNNIPAAFSFLSFAQPPSQSLPKKRKIFTPQ